MWETVATNRSEWQKAIYEGTRHFELRCIENLKAKCLLCLRLNKERVLTKHTLYLHYVHGKIDIYILPTLFIFHVPSSRIHQFSKQTENILPTEHVKGAIYIFRWIGQELVTSNGEIKNVEGKINIIFMLY